MLGLRPPGNEEFRLNFFFALFALPVTYETASKERCVPVCGRGSDRMSQSSNPVEGYQ
ncbi:hypothetical protein Bpfe_031270, partial [Biomphalaria pfeifferi]